VFNACPVGLLPFPAAFLTQLVEGMYGSPPSGRGTVLRRSLPRAFPFASPTSPEGIPPLAGTAGKTDDEGVVASGRGGHHDVRGAKDEVLGREPLPSMDHEAMFRPISRTPLIRHVTGLMSNCVSAPR
jgi:hypothetical protein